MPRQSCQLTVEQIRAAVEFLFPEGVKTLEGEPVESARQLDDLVPGIQSNIKFKDAFGNPLWEMIKRIIGSVSSAPRNDTNGIVSKFLKGLLGAHFEVRGRQDSEVVQFCSGAAPKDTARSTGGVAKLSYKSFGYTRNGGGSMFTCIPDIVIYMLQQPAQEGVPMIVESSSQAPADSAGYMGMGDSANLIPANYNSDDEELRGSLEELRRLRDGVDDIFPADSDQYHQAQHHQAHHHQAQHHQEQHHQAQHHLAQHHQEQHHQAQHHQEQHHQAQHHLAQHHQEQHHQAQHHLAQHHQEQHHQHNALMDIVGLNHELEQQKKIIRQLQDKHQADLQRQKKQTSKKRLSKEKKR